jgi:putative transposase
MRARIKAERPLHIVVVDHIQVDAFVMDDWGQSLGRPWLTIAVDVFSRMVTGFHLALTPPSRISASMCLLQSVCSKKTWLAERGVEGDWPVAGTPEVLRLDPQSFFGLRGFGRICADMRIQAISKSAGERKFGAHVEALIGSRIGSLALLVDPDQTGRADEHADVAPRGSLAELERHIARQIVQRYHCNGHPALRRAPNAIWRENENVIALRAPANCMNFRLSFMPEEECAVEDLGIILHGRRYWSQRVRKLFEDGVERVAVKFDPRDPSKVFVQTPSGRYVKVNEDVGGALALAARDVPGIRIDGGGFLKNGVSYALQKLRFGKVEAVDEVEPVIGFGSVDQIERRCAASCPFAVRPASSSVAAPMDVERPVSYVEESSLV